MAPRFKQYMYNTYRTERGVSAMVCFQFSEDELRFPFRDELAAAVIEAANLDMHKSEGSPYPVDSWLRFFADRDSGDVYNFVARKLPSFLSRILTDSIWRDYCKERERIKQMIRFELSTSHDNTCIEVNSTIHTDQSLSELIETVAGRIDIEMPKNNGLPPISKLFFSNKSFDL